MVDHTIKLDKESGLLLLLQNGLRLKTKLSLRG